MKPDWNITVKMATFKNIGNVGEGRRTRGNRDYKCGRCDSAARIVVEIKGSTIDPNISQSPFFCRKHFHEYIDEQTADPKLEIIDEINKMRAHWEEEPMDSTSMLNWLYNLKERIIKELVNKP